MMLSTADLARLETASRLLVSPLATPDPEVWMAEAGQAVRELVGGDHVVLQFADGPRPYFSEDAPGVVDGVLTYVDAVLTDGVRYSDPVTDLWNQLRREQNVGAFSWDINKQMVEEHGVTIDEGHVINDVLRRQGYHDFVGMMGATAAGESMIWVLQREHGSLAFGDHTVAVMKALLPAYHAGLDALARFGAQRAALDAVAEPLVVFSADGLELYRNAALTDLMRKDPERLVVERGLTVLGAESRLTAGAATGRPVSAETEVRTVRGRYVLRTAALPPGLFGPDPATLVTVVADGTSVLPDAQTVRARLGLTRRESEVALLLAGGASNADIAERLFVSLHTARHHVENVFAKLGITNRAAVAGHLLNVA